MWHDAAMPRDSKRLSKFDRAALEIAEGIANIPFEGRKSAVKLLEGLENKPRESKSTKRLSAKLSTQVKKKTSGSKNDARKNRTVRKTGSARLFAH
jgi:hypothetical protein